MTQEEKQLLLQDLCGRLPYGIIVDYKEDEYDFYHWKISTLHTPAYSQSGNLINTSSDGWIEYEKYKGCGMSTGSIPLHIEKTLPFLRPISSITEDELDECRETCKYRQVGQSVLDCATYRTFDWLNKKMFDYRELIPKGLALEAPEGMYKTE